MSRRRFRSVQSVAHAGVAFNDHRDSIDGVLSNAGASQFDATGGAPRSLVHRFSEFDSRSGVRRVDALLPGYGAGEPHADLRRMRSRGSVVRSSAVVRVNSALASQRRAASWRALNVLRFPYPRSVAVCVRRKVRRGVLFAKQVAGRRGGSPGPYKRTEFSQWAC